MTQSNSFPTIDPSMLEGATGGAARVNARANDPKLELAMTSLKTNLDDLVSAQKNQQSSSSSTMMPMMMMMMMKNRG